MRPLIERCRCRCIARWRKLKEVLITKGALRDKAQQRKEGRNVDADQIIETLLLSLPLLPPPTARDLADCMRDGCVLIGLLANIVERLHKLETTPRPGRRGTSCRQRPARLGGGLCPGHLQE